MQHQDITLNMPSGLRPADAAGLIKRNENNLPAAQSLDLKRTFERMWDAEFNPDETRVVPVGEDKDASNLAPFLGHATLVAEARKVVPRCLTQERRAAAYLHPAPADWC